MIALYCGHNTNKQSKKMSNFNTQSTESQSVTTLKEDTSYTNDKGESILVKQITYYTELDGYRYIDGAFCDEFDVNGGFQNRGWYPIRAIERFTNKA